MLTEVLLLLFAFIRVHLRLILCYVFVLFNGLTGVHAQQWESLPEMPIAVAAPAASVTGRKAVLTGGMLLGGGASKAVQVMDLDTFEWTEPVQLNTARYQHAQVTLPDGRVLVAGGRSSRIPGQVREAIKGCELIDLMKNTCTPTGDLPMPMHSPTLHLLADGRVVAAGGHAVAIYDPGEGAWTTVAPLSFIRREHESLILDDGTLLIIGGIRAWTIKRVDLTTGEVTKMKAYLPTGIDDHAVVPLPDGRVWIIGGQGMDGATVDQTWLLTVGDGAQSSLADGPRLGIETGMADHVLIQTPHGVVISGGESQQGRVDTELADAFWLDPATLGVRRLPNTAIAHDDAAGLNDGPWAIVFGGQVKASFLGVKVPTPVRAVHRIRLDSDGDSPE